MSIYNFSIVWTLRSPPTPGGGILRKIGLTNRKNLIQVVAGEVRRDERQTLTRSFPLGARLSDTCFTRGMIISMLRGPESKRGQNFRKPGDETFCSPPPKTDFFNSWGLCVLTLTHTFHVYIKHGQEYV